MNKIDKYLRRFAYKIVTSESKQSRYYTIGELIVRGSDHIGKNSDGNISIIIDRENYILYVPTTNKVSLISYEDCKTLIKGIVLHASLFLTGDPQFQRSLIEENKMLEAQVRALKQELNESKTGVRSKESNDTSMTTIKILLNKLTKAQKKRVKSIYGSDRIPEMNAEQLRIIWKNPEIQKYIQQNN